MHATDAASAAPGALPLQAWSADVFAKLDVRRPDPVLAPVLARGAITLVTGPRGVGKSWLALAMAHAAASGGDLLGWSAAAARRVVYLDMCAGQGLLHERLAAIAGRQPPRALVLVPGDAQTNGLPDIALESGLASLDELTVDADLVVLDGVAALVRGSRGLAARWQALATWLRGLRRRGCAVLLVDAAEPRALAALADTVLRLERPLDWSEEEGARFRLRVAASRGLTGPSCRRFEARLAVRRGRAVWTKIAERDDDAILAWRLSEGGFTSREIARKLDVSPATAWRLIERGEAMDPTLRDNAELRAVAAEERREAARNRAAARREAKAAMSPLRPHPHPLSSPAGGTRDTAPHPSEPSPACGRVQGESGAAAMKNGEAAPIADSPEAVKQPAPPPQAPPPLTRAERLWRTPISRLPITGGAP